MRAYFLSKWYLFGGLFTFYTLATETRGLERMEIENFLYDYYKSIDKTRLIVCRTGGWPELKLKGKQKTDLYDIHDYTGCHWHYVDYLKDSLTYYHRGYTEVSEGKEKPLINGETMQVLGAWISGFRWRLLEDEFAMIRKSFPEIDRTYYVSLIKKLQGMGGAYPYILSDIGHFGLFDLAFLDRNLEVYAEIHKKAIELFRQHRDILSGFNFHHLRAFPFYQARKKLVITPQLLKDTGGLLYTAQILDLNVPLPLMKVFKQACSPCVVYLSDLKRNVIAGSEIKGTLSIINDSFHQKKELKVNINLLDKDGKLFRKETVKIGNAGISECIVKNILLPVSSKQESGEYTINLQLKNDKGELLNTNRYSGYILSMDKKKNTIRSEKKIAIYSSNKERKIKTALLFNASTGIPRLACLDPFHKELHIQANLTGKIFDQLGIEYENINDFSDLSPYDILVIGFDSSDEKVISSGQKITEWIEKGGKLISFEQFAPAGNKGVKIPWCPEFSFKSYTKNTNGEGAATFNFADKIVPDHPLFSELGRRALSNWDDFRGSVVEAIIEPLMEGVISASKVSQPYKMGMAVAEVKRGKGLILFSQLLASPRYGKDSVATRYLENLLSYALSDNWDGRYACDYTKAIDKVIISEKDIFMVNLRDAANFGLKGSPDGKPLEKQSWLDEKVAKHTLLDHNWRVHNLTPGKIWTEKGIPFDLIDPESNQGKSCIVVSNSAKHKKYFSQKKEIKVHSGAKRLFFLMTAVCPHYFKKGTQIGEIAINYSQNTLGATQGASIPLLFDENISHWWGASGKWTVDAEIIKLGQSSSIFFIEWENLFRDSGIESIELIAEKDVDLVLIGFTLEKIAAKLNK